MSPRKLMHEPPPRVGVALKRITVAAGLDIHDARIRKGWRLADVATRAGLSISEVHRVEAAKGVSLEAYVRIAMALGLEPNFTLGRHPANSIRDSDPVHAALGEVEAGRLRAFGRDVRLDEPYQHYQFAGRADLIAIDVPTRALLHIENRTRFPDIQSFAGSWNAKRAYLANQLKERLGIARWAAVDHVVVALWSSEVLHVFRLREQTFRSLCPDPPEGFTSWWSGGIPAGGERSSLVVLDPLPGMRRSRRDWIGLDAARKADPRFRGYADALDRLRGAGLA
jgi:transcriptional regulator with XRE-family HTH domain